MSESVEEFLGELRLGRELTAASQVAAIGLITLLGLIFLLVERPIQLVGRQGPLAGILAFAALGLTLLSIVELLGGTGERGGTYLLTHETLGGFWSFLVGWSILAGSLATGVALALVAVEVLAHSFVVSEITRMGLAAVLVSLLLLVQLFQAQPRLLTRQAQAVLVSLGLLVVAFAGVTQTSALRLQFQPSPSLGRLLDAVSWLTVCYIAFEAVLTARRQIRSPAAIQPRALWWTLFAGGALFIIALLLFGRIGPPRPGSGYLILLTNSSNLPPWLIIVLGLAISGLAANTCFMTAARQLHALSRAGALPRELRRIRKPFPVPGLLYLTLAALAVPMILWVSQELLISTAAVLFLVVMVMANLTAIYSHRAEPERNRVFLVPFTPLLPILGIVVNLILLRSFLDRSIIPALIWLGAGAVVYVLYARIHQVEAQEGEIVFGHERTKREIPADTYRILIPLGPGIERKLLLSLGASLARQLGGVVIPLQVIPMADPMGMEGARRTARDRNTFFEWSTRLVADTGVRTFPITRLDTSIAEGILDTANEENCDLVLLPWKISETSQRPQIGSVVRTVARSVPCDLAVVAYHAGSGKPQEPSDNGHRKGGFNEADGTYQPARILVPTAGGPNAPLATRLALLLTREHDAQVSTVYITPANATQEDIQAGEARIQNTIATMKEQAKDLPPLASDGRALEDYPIDGQVVAAPSIVEGIAETGKDFDLVFMGATEESFLDQVLFGNIPEQVAQACTSPVVMVKRYRGLPRLWLMRVWNALNASLPQVTREDQMETYRGVHRGARPDVDFFVMIGLATLLATFGLLLDSAAVIIGAMLVAPLFTPLIALCLAIAQGNIRLLRLAVESLLKGIALAIGLGAVITAISPPGEPTTEIIARIRPGFLDLFVALASGAAGAYAVARKDVATSLPGVAIAAALVPPLSVVGIGLTMGDLGVAGGASLLFAANLIAIALAGAVTFLLLGFRPDPRGDRSTHLRRSLLTTILLFLIIVIPLGAIFFQSANQTLLEQTILAEVDNQFKSYAGIERVGTEAVIIDNHGGVQHITIPVYAENDLPSSLPLRVSNALDRKVDGEINVRFVVLPLVNVPEVE